MAMYTSNLAAMLYTAKFCWQYSKASSGSLAWSLGCIGIGCAISIIFGGTANLFLVSMMANPTLEVPHVIVPLINWLASMAALGIFVGYAIEPVTRTIILIRSWRALEAMWGDLVEVAPDIAFPALRWGISGEYGITLQDRLYRRVMEIKDGIWMLRENLPSGFLDKAVRASAAATCWERAQVRAEALWLNQAVSNRRAGIRYGSSAEPLDRPGLSYSEEVVWLRDLARVYKSIRQNSLLHTQPALSRST